MTPIIIQLSGCDTATCGDMTETNQRTGGIFSLARKMVAAGVFDMLPVEIWRNGTKCFNAAPLSYWAGRTVSGGDKSERIVRWSPMPEGLHKPT